jgi:hypothetical protein
MQTIFYDDLAPSAPIPRSIFLAGPIANGICRTPWRAQVLDYLTIQGFMGTVILPEFRAGLFAELAPGRFRTDEVPTPSGMRTTSYNILDWETAGIELSTLVLFWMPFCLAEPGNPTSLPGFTTRAEVSREVARSPWRVVLGMPQGALSSSHIRYHAYREGLPIWPTLKQTIDVALARLATA